MKDELLVRVSFVKGILKTRLYPVWFKNNISLEKILNGEDIKYTSFNTLLDFNIPESILTNLKINTGENVSFEYCLFHIKNNQLE